MPLIPGICTSVIRQSIFLTTPDARNASAESNVRAANPKDLIRLSAARRMASSSSTIAIKGNSDKWPILDAPAPLWRLGVTWLLQS